MKRLSWVCTLATQVCLCFALYVALNLGQPQESLYRNSRTPHDFYFISVNGGFRALQEQTHLLKLIENVAKTYNASFVVNISELGDNDPLKHNATLLFPALKVPWYSTRVSGQELSCFVQKFELPHGKTLDIIGLDTGLLQESMTTGFSSGIRDNISNWLANTLETTKSNWRIVFGYHSLLPCEQQKEAKQIYEPLHNIFIKHGVNLCLSSQGCHDSVYRDGIAYIGSNPSLTQDLSSPAKGREMANGFLLHRISLLELVTYFVTLDGEVMHKIEVKQRGKEPKDVM